jgi:GAF domain-containing protein
MNLPSAYVWPVQRVRAWTAALDAFAAAGEVAVAAESETELGTGIARSLIGEYADWAIVDLSAGGLPARSVVGPDAGPQAVAAAARLTALPAHACPMIASAMSQQTPLVRAAMTDRAELGVLPDGRPVSAVIEAGSCAVGPVTVDGVASGAITIVRSRSRPEVTFLELSVLAHIADLAGAAVARLQAAKPPSARRWSFPR